MDVNDQDFAAEVLQMAHENLNGLWDAWWRANAMYPDISVSERLAAAERAIQTLADRGAIVLSRGTWDLQDRVPDADVVNVLREWRSWMAVGDGQDVFFVAT